MSDITAETEEKLIENLGEAELVVADGNRFKIKLGIGEDAYASLKLKNMLLAAQDVKEAGGVGIAAGSAVAASSTVAGYLGAGGLLVKLGLASAITGPFAFAIVAAGVVSGGAYFGAKRMIFAGGSSRVETIPKFINTPIDLLGATIFDMMAGLAVKVADFSGPIDDAERTAIIGYFDEVWGISPDYARRALPLIELQVRDITLKDMVRKLAEQQMDNPDCNPEAMRKALGEFLEEVAHADGERDEREDLAIEMVERELAAHLSTRAQVSRGAGKYASKAGELAQSGGVAIASGAQSALRGIRGALFGRKDRG